MKDLIFSLSPLNVGQPFSEEIGVICTVPYASAHITSKVQAFTASALDYNTLRTPPVDHTERHFLGLLMPLDILDYLRI
jgi:hypothetical protein